jgi:hypothetical protein
MSSIQGVYVIDAVHLQNAKGPNPALGIDSSMLTNSNVDGFSLIGILPWSTVEPSDGTFAWQTLDSVIAQAAGNGKVVTIGVMPGWQTPSWVYAEGAQSYQFIWDQKIWGPGYCSVATIPVPWDPVYLAKWSGLIKAFGARYNGNYTVTAVKITGVSSEDEETSLPWSVDVPLSDGTTSCTGYNNTLDWQTAGYNRDLIENTWRQIAGMYQQAFPNKLLIAALQPNAFPPIDANGNIFLSSTGTDPDAPADIIADGIANFGAQLALQNDGLTAQWIWTDIVDYAAQVVTGYQTFSALGLNLPTAMDLAIAADAEYLELYEGDLNNPDLQSALASARQQLN